MSSIPLHPHCDYIHIVGGFIMFYTPHSCWFSAPLWSITISVRHISWFSLVFTAFHPSLVARPPHCPPLLQCGWLCGDHSRLWKRRAPGDHLYNEGCRWIHDTYTYYTVCVYIYIVNCSFSAVLWYLICCRWGYWLSDQSEARTNGRIAFVFSDTCSLGSWAKGSSDLWPSAIVYMTVHNGGI